MELIYYCDNTRHLVCKPYSVENLHSMAIELGIDRCWYQNHGHPHYDIPLSRVKEIQAKCTVVPSRRIWGIIAGTDEE